MIVDYLNWTELNSFDDMTHQESSNSVLILRSTCGGAESATSLDRYPLWCDLTLLPELDTSQQRFTSQQRLNPCGIDTVLLRRDMMAGQGYLMSLANCFAVVENEKIPITPSPANFFFESPSVAHIEHREGAMRNEKDRSTNLQLVFDMTALQGRLMKDQANAKQPPPESFSSKQTVCEASSSDNDALLRVLETLAEREARDLDRMLILLAAIFAILVVIYAWTALSILTKKKGQTALIDTATNWFRTPFAKPAPRPTRPPSVPNESVHSGNRRTIKEDAPPVDSVTFDRSRTDAPSLIEEPTHVRQIIGTLEAKPRSTFKKPLAANPPASIAEPPRFFASRNNNKASPPFAAKQARPPLSPCSRLAKEWEDKKVSRRSKRRTRAPRLVPPQPLLQQNQPRKKSIVPITPPDPSENNAVPLCPTSVSEESFLNDYW